jgi:predicted nuclease of restriction endonuclease-like RecB superfamily
MLTGRLVRVRYARDKIVPCYVDTVDAVWHEAAERLLDLFRGARQWTRGELEEAVREAFGDAPNPLVHQGLAKLLLDRCEFEVAAAHPPEQLREAVFRAAAHRRMTPLVPVAEGAEAEPPVLRTFNRSAVLREVAAGLGLEPDAVVHGLFADLKSEQRLVSFEDITAERLLQRYNLALAQAVLLRAVGVRVYVRGEPPRRYRQVLRQAKFHRLICAIEAAGPDAYFLRLDGPLSLFSATQKYGLQLALFLPAVLRCRDFDLEADLRWGPQRKPKTFTLCAGDGLVSSSADTGMYVPPELAMFVGLFRKKVADWDIVEEAGVLPLGNGFWVPDFQLVHRATGRFIYLEVLGFWRRSSVEQHLQRLREHARAPFLLAVSEQLRVDEADLEGLPAGIHRFRQMPLVDEVARLAEEILLGSKTTG